MISSLTNYLQVSFVDVSKCVLLTYIFLVLVLSFIALWLEGYPYDIDSLVFVGATLGIISAPYLQILHMSMKYTHVLFVGCKILCMFVRWGLCVFILAKSSIQLSFLS